MASLLLLGAALAGCSRSSGSGDGQVIAVVGDEELTQPMLETALSGPGAVGDPRDKRVQRAVSEKLIDQLLLAAEAEREGLTKDPAVDRRINAARREVLATAYLERMLDSQAPASTQIRAYYEAHPQLFSARKAYRLVELAASTAPDEGEPVKRAFLDQSQSLDTIAATLARRGADVMVRRFTAAADALPEALAPQIQKATQGSRLAFHMAGVQHLVLVEEVMDRAITLDQAREAVAERMIAERFRKTVAQRLAGLRGKAPVTLASYGRDVLHLSERR